MNRRPILRKVHLVNPSNPDGNLPGLVERHRDADKDGQESFLCSECKNDHCEHCGVVFDDLCSEGVLHA